MVSNAVFKIEKPKNEPVLSYAPGTKEREELKARLVELRTQEIEIPLIIGGKEVRTGKLGMCIIPHNKEVVIGRYHMAGEKEVNDAIEAALAARHDWESMPWEHRASIFLKAAEMLAGPCRSTINAATMLCQSKTAYQAEIDSACELIDMLKFNAYFLNEIYKEQPESTKDSWNRMEYRALEGFVFAVTPFNFTSIAGNLPTSAAMAGNVVLWKPASSAVYSAYHVMTILRKAGLPDGVINFIPGPGNVLGSIALLNPWLAGVHFTGSTATFQSMWQTVGQNLPNYRTYPRLVGETGGKDFVFVHPSADLEPLVTALVRGAFEFQGQKCSAASRAYVPESMWPALKKRLVEEISTIKMGDIEDFTNFMGAVIDAQAFRSIKGYIDYAKESPEAEIICGGNADDSVGFFIEPTVIVTTNPRFKTMEEEIFGPVLTIYIYKDEEIEEALDLCDSTSIYGLTGAVFAQDREAIVKIEKRLTHAAGNFYINDKPTGAVIAQQPFGGARASGTNDKAGSKINMMRWVSPRAIKEHLNPPVGYRYPFMDEK
ncbi:MAG TPA: L-glutamate gamma-semialdehyde dehydrogenase [Acetomicrobium sp.]|jgi:1-pyrroline-5-carboxylate dehydrogenase|uniref:L-glutamate gamma-semialdehyde dehydrogenase n=1 Tax=Acetomicrobium TaxID=49894 RepID=UPI0026F1347B|nr:L-glutamate gamma-semialdehyde dehydrogenase [Acetomicrobium mobile]HQA36951.1 L-glutamate gamma-semialdehyde dehydrogenase [Acetomicrobium sp.]HQC88055.1 L-glutamate gamma-semialdehyde dehydrogenase [Acetomicrobium sp.]